MSGKKCLKLNTFEYSTGDAQIMISSDPLPGSMQLMKKKKKIINSHTYSMNYISQQDQQN